MKVKCISVYPTEKQISKMGRRFYRRQSFGLTQGKEYLVLGLNFEIDSVSCGTGACVELISDNGGLSNAPLFSFEITDPRASRFWEVRLWEDGGLTLWPPLFYTTYFRDDLSESKSDVVAEFRRVWDMMNSEFTDNEEDCSTSATRPTGATSP